MARRFSSGLTAWVATVLLSASSAAHTIDVPDFQAGSPLFGEWLQEIDVAPHADGGFVVVWGEFDFDESNATNRIVTHRFSRSGVEAAPPVRIDGSGYGLNPVLASDGAGGFIGAWMWSNEGVARALYSRRLDSRGQAVSAEQRIDTPSTGPMIKGAVAYGPDGPIYFWKQNGLWFRPYDRFGAPLSSAVGVGSNTPGFEGDIAILPDGGFVLVWTNRWLADQSWARVYDANRQPLGPAFALDTVGLVDAVATSASGEIAVVGEALYDAASGGAGGARGEVWLRRFASDGTPVGSRVIVRSIPGNFSLQADAAYDSRGNLFVVWREYDSTANVIYPARARAYGADGSALGGDFALSADGADEVRTTALSDDCFANAWYRSARAYVNVVCLCDGGSASCGDGVLDGTCEACDDGDDVDGDGCDSDCTLSACGNGIVAGDEQCDDGNEAGGDGCDANCTATGCGNGVVTSGEQCDDGNVTDGDGCDANCRPSGCGNGAVGAGEQCDDGNAASGDGCDADCTHSRCGNGIAAGAEACDDGNAVEGDGCDSNCTLSGCGNGVVVGEEECDDANRTSGDGCDRDCLVESCGNGRREGNEQCDSGGEGDTSVGGCNADCTLRSVHDSVVLPLPAVEVAIPVGNDPFTTNVIVQVQNADVLPARESPGHAIRLTASDGDCPPGTVSGQPDFDRGIAGVQDTVVVDGGIPATAIADVTVSRATFQPFDHRIPQRCTLRFTAVEAGATSDDPTPDNNSIVVHLDVTDTGDPVHSDEDEFFVESMKPLTIKLPPGASIVTKQIKPVVRRSKELPVTVAELEVTVSASDGDCPPGTVGLVDFDRRVSGHQSRLMLRRGRRAKGFLGLIIRADAFASPSDESPRRCTPLITVTGAGDTDPSNNTTRLVVDVVDRNDF